MARLYGASESNGNEAYLSAKTRDPVRWPEGARGQWAAPGSGGLAEVASGPHSLARGALGWWADEATLRPPAPRTRRPGGDCTSGGSSPIGTVAP